MQQLWAKLKLSDRIILGLAVIVCTASIVYLRAPQRLHRDKRTEKLGQMESMKNQVRIRPSGSFTWFTLESWYSEDVYNQDGVFTGEDSTAVIRLDSGEMIYVDPNSLIVIEKAQDGEIRLNVVTGEIKTEGPTVKPRQIIKKNQRLVLTKKTFQIEDQPVPAVVQTEPEIPAVPAESASEPVAVEESILAPLTETAVEPAPPPSKPAALKRTLVPIPAATPLVLQPDVTARWKGSLPSVKGQWNAVPEARLYIVEIFQKSAKNLKLIHKIKTSDPHIEWSTDQKGEFKIRVSALVESTKRKPASISKARGFQDFVIPVLTVFPRPAGLFPQNRQLVVATKNQSLYFKWQRSKRFSLYAVQFSKDKEFKSVDQELLLQSFELKNNPNLTPGLWHWRVKGLSDTGESPWGPTQEFRLIYE